jgi:hypothetical protein
MNHLVQPHGVLPWLELDERIGDRKGAVHGSVLRSGDQLIEKRGSLRA